jgi:hypothetical protein
MRELNVPGPKDLAVWCEDCGVFHVPPFELSPWPEDGPTDQEALDYGEGDPVDKAPEVVERLGKALATTEITQQSALKARQAIGLLQEVVRGE